MQPLDSIIQSQKGAEGLELEVPGLSPDSLKLPQKRSA